MSSRLSRGIGGKDSSPPVFSPEKLEGDISPEKQAGEGRQIRPSRNRGPELSPDPSQIKRPQADQAQRCKLAVKTRQ
jgi:hypothetical protein